MAHVHVVYHYNIVEIEFVATTPEKCGNIDYIKAVP